MCFEHRKLVSLISENNQIFLRNILVHFWLTFYHIQIIIVWKAKAIFSISNFTNGSEARKCNVIFVKTKKNTVKILTHFSPLLHYFRYTLKKERQPFILWNTINLSKLLIKHLFCVHILQYWFLCVCYFILSF